MMNTHKSTAVLVVAVMLITITANAQTEQQAADTVFLYHDVAEKPLFAGKALYDKGGFHDYIRENGCECLFEGYGHGVGATIIVEFIIDVDGSLIDTKILRNGDPLLDAEALRVVKSSPKWTPGKHDDKLVKVKYILPIRHRTHGCVVPPGWVEECMKCLQEKSKKVE